MLQYVHNIRLLHLALVQILLDAGAKFDAPDFTADSEKAPQTASSAALYEFNHDVTRILANAGADVDSCKVGEEDEALRVGCIVL
jgi:hypothetical protein